jgi:hypothetical protein
LSKSASASAVFTAEYESLHYPTSKSLGILVFLMQPILSLIPINLNFPQPKVKTTVVSGKERAIYL